MIVAPYAQMTSGGNPVDLATLSEQLDTIRVARQTATQTKTPAPQAASEATDANTIATAISDDTIGAAAENSEAKAPAIDELTLEDEDKAALDDRNKR